METNNYKGQHMPNTKPEPKRKSVAKSKRGARLSRRLVKFSPPLFIAGAAIAAAISILLVVTSKASSFLPFGPKQSSFLPFGPKQLTKDAFGNPYTGGYINAGSVDKLNAMLPIARAHGSRLIIKLPGDRRLFQNPDGTFNLDFWKQNIDRLRGFDFAPYVADGTVIGAELINEPNDPNNWGGAPITKAQFEQCGAYAKSIWPTLPVGGGRSDYLLVNAPWRHIDFGHSQYQMRKGDINTWINQTVQESKDADVGLLMSLNFYAGQLDNTSMTPNQIYHYYSAMVKDTYSCALTGYLYDATFLERPEVASAMNKINDLAKTHTAPPCYVGGHVKPR